MHRVLVVEDSIVVNKHITTLLENSGVEVCSAFTATDALTSIKEFEPDLVLLDIMMEQPDSGLQIARSSEIKLSGTPIIFLTALTDSNTLDEIKSISPYGYITKPFNEVELLTNVDVAISKNHAEKALRQNYEYHEAVFNVLGSSVVVFDQDCKLINFNDTFSNQINSTSTEYFKLSIKEIFSAKDFETGEKIENFRKLESGKFYKLQVRHPEHSQVEELVITEVKMKKIRSGIGEFEILMFSDGKELMAKKRLEERLRLKDLSQLVHGQETERRRVSAELHDNLSQVLNSAKLALQTHKNAYAIDMIDHALEETRRISENLLPAKLVDFPIEKSINSYINKLKNVVAFTVSFYTEDVPAITNEIAKIHIFRILQEAVGNAVKYSECSRLTIQLIGMEDLLLLSVEDDGKGFDLRASVLNESNGLKNMEYRAELLGTTLEIESNIGKGTFLSVKVPTQSFWNENSIS